MHFFFDVTPKSCEFCLLPHLETFGLVTLHLTIETYMSDNMYWCVKLYVLMCETICLSVWDRVSMVRHCVLVRCDQGTDQELQSCSKFIFHLGDKKKNSVKWKVYSNCSQWSNRQWWVTRNIHVLIRKLLFVKYVESHFHKW